MLGVVLGMLGLRLVMLGGRVSVVWIRISTVRFTYLVQCKGCKVFLFRNI